VCVCLSVCVCALFLSARYLKNGFMDHHQIWWVGAGGEPLVVNSEPLQYMMIVLPWLDPRHESIVRRPIVSSELCLLMPSPSSFSCNSKLTDHVSFSESIFRVFFGRFLLLWPCGMLCSAWLAMCVPASSMFSVSPVLASGHFLA